MSSIHLGPHPSIEIDKFVEELQDYLKYIKVEPSTKQFLELQIDLMAHVSMMMLYVDRLFLGEIEEPEFMKLANQLNKAKRSDLQSKYPKLFEQ
jgi:hypothetical protein